VALDARTGQVKWQTKSSGTLTSGVIVADGKVLSGRACGTVRDDCYISAHDAKTGKEAWRFYTVPAAGEPGDETWGGSPPGGRLASTWGLAGGYDPARRLIIWGIANPMPNTRAARHGGNARAIPLSAPADLYSNSTGELNPDTGKTFINENDLVDAPGKRRTICFWNTKSYWPMAYHPGLNSLFVSYNNNCLDMTAAIPASEGKPAVPERRDGIPRPGSKPEEFAGIAKVNVATGEIQHIYKGRAPGQGAVLATAGDLIFWGDLDQKLRAFDAQSGKIL